MKWHLPFAVLLVLTTSVFATEQVRKAQSELKEEGFYFGDVSGESSSEFTAALRRYQIRNGLDVTGELNNETLEALGLKAAAPVQPIAPKKETQAAPAPPIARTGPPVNLRKEDSSARDSDQEFLESETTRAPRPRAVFPPSDDPSVVRRPAPLDGSGPVPVPGEEYAGVFAGTPYASAPREVQDQTVRQAQALLARRGFYRDPVDGEPGPATEEAILTYQRSAGLPLTGRLDLETLSGLRLLPRRPGGNVPLQPFRAPGKSSARGTRDIWIQ